MSPSALTVIFVSSMVRHHTRAELKCVGTTIGGRFVMISGTRGKQKSSADRKDSTMGLVCTHMVL